MMNDIKSLLKTIQELETRCIIRAMDKYKCNPNNPFSRTESVDYFTDRVEVTIVEVTPHDDPSRGEVSLSVDELEMDSTTWASHISAMKDAYLKFFKKKATAEHDHDLREYERLKEKLGL